MYLTKSMVLKEKCSFCAFSVTGRSGSAVQEALKEHFLHSHGEGSATWQTARLLTSGTEGNSVAGSTPAPSANRPTGDTELF